VAARAGPPEAHRGGRRRAGGVVIERRPLDVRAVSALARIGSEDTRGQSGAAEGVDSLRRPSRRDGWLAGRPTGASIGATRRRWIEIVARVWSVASDKARLTTAYLGGNAWGRP